jgi:hypothetical protein
VPVPVGSAVGGSLVAVGSIGDIVSVGIGVDVAGTADGVTVGTVVAGTGVVVGDDVGVWRVGVSVGGALVLVGLGVRVARGDGVIVGVGVGVPVAVRTGCGIGVGKTTRVTSGAGGMAVRSLFGLSVGNGCRTAPLLGRAGGSSVGSARGRLITRAVAVAWGGVGLSPPEMASARSSESMVGVTLGCSVGAGGSVAGGVLVGRSSALCVGAAINVPSGPRGPGSASAGSTKNASAPITPSARTVAATVDVTFLPRACARLRPRAGAIRNTPRATTPSTPLTPGHHLLVSCRLRKSRSTVKKRSGSSK